MSTARGPGDPATRQRIFEAALRLITKHGGAGVTLARVARAARVSRQALYLHFSDRAGLFTALVRYADERRGLPEAIQRVEDAPSGVAALRLLVAMQSKMNPAIWPLAGILDSVRGHDQAAERSWQDRLANRLRGCRAIVARLERDGYLRDDLNAAMAADLLWTLTSLRTWHDLVMLRGWTARQYEQRLTDLLLMLLVPTDHRRPAKAARK